jgi:two-component SAPR family response regulator
MFGSLVVEEGDHKIVQFPTVRCVEMLGYLFLKSGEFVSRQRLIEAIWPDIDLKIGKNRVSGTVHSCKKAFASAGLDFEKFVSVEGQYLSALVPGVRNEWSVFWTAVHEARTTTDDAAKESAYSRIFDLFRDRVLTDLSGAWVDLARAEAAAAYCEAAIFVAEKAEARGQSHIARNLRERANFDRYR